MISLFARRSCSEIWPGLVGISNVLQNFDRRPTYTSIDSHCNALVQPPNSLVPSLVHILRPETDLKVKHGIVGLLKHLSQPKATKSILGDEKVLEAISKSKIWDRSADMGEVIQMSAIGVAKHLTAGNGSEIFHPSEFMNYSRFRHSIKHASSLLKGINADRTHPNP
jgi:hypothetical protein